MFTIFLACWAYLNTHTHTHTRTHTHTHTHTHARMTPTVVKGHIHLPECAEGLFIMQVGGANCGNHCCLGVAPQAILEDPGEGGVSVRYVHLVPPPTRLLSQQRNHLTQRVQGPVDTGTFLWRGARGRGKREGQEWLGSRREVNMRRGAYCFVSSSHAISSLHG